MPIGKERLRRLTMRRSIGVMASELNAVTPWLMFKFKRSTRPLRTGWSLYFFQNSICQVQSRQAKRMSAIIHIVASIIANMCSWILQRNDLRQNPKASDMNRPGFPGECFICELRLPDHRFRWKHNKLFLLLPVGYGPAFPAIVDCYTSPPT